jgi:hypothetical protein
MLIFLGKIPGKISSKSENSETNSGKIWKQSEEDPENSYYRMVKIPGKIS